MNTSRIRKSIVGLALGLASLAGLTATGATPASAASEVKFCFDWTSGVDYANQPVYLYEWQGKWVNIRKGATNASGCGVFGNVSTSKYYTVVAYTVLGDTNVGMASFFGSAPTYASPGTGRTDIGTATVSLYRCYQGLAGYCAGQV